MDWKCSVFMQLSSLLLQGLRVFHRRQFGDDVRSPKIDVVLADDLPHPRHPAPLFFCRHFDRPPDALGELLDRVGIDRDGVGQFPSRPREAAQQEDPRQIILGGDELLRYQVHSVVERTDDAQIGQLIVGADLLMGELPLEVDDGAPVTLGIFPVRPIDQLIDLPDEIVIAFYMGAAGRRDLDEDESFPVLRILLQEPVNRQEPFDDPLGVIDPLDADGHDLAGQIQFLTDLLLLFQDALRRRPENARVHADGKGPDEGFPAAPHDAEFFRIDPGFHQAVGRIQEVVAVVLNVKPDQIAAQHPFQDFLLVGADRKDLRIGPGDVPEQGDGRIRAFLLDHLRQEREVIVLDEDERFVRRQLFEKALGEFFIDLPVHLPVGLPEDRPRVGDMTQRPQSLVGKPVVIPFLFLLGQPDPFEDVPLIPGRDPELVPGVDKPPIGVSAAVCHPGPSAGPHDGIDRRHHPACRKHHLGLVAFRIENMKVGLPIGHDEERILAELRHDQIPETFLRPELLLFHSSLGLFDHGLAGNPQAQGHLFHLLGELAQLPGSMDGGLCVGVPPLKVHEPFRQTPDGHHEKLAKRQQRDEQEGDNQDDQCDADPLPEPDQSREYVGSIVDDLHEAEDLVVVVEDRMDITVDEIIPEFHQLAVGFLLRDDLPEIGFLMILPFRKALRDDKELSFTVIEDTPLQPFPCLEFLDQPLGLP